MYTYAHTIGGIADMTGAFYKQARIACVALALVQGALSQTCYYPNGAEAKGEKPCASGDGSACCPDKWACLDNGLCYYEPDNLYGRYSCTDKDWKAEGCPSNLCTYGMQAAGGEGIPQCSNHGNQWCCDGDRTNVDCCQESPEPRPFFSLDDGQQYAIIGQSTANSAPNLASITGLVSEDGNSPSSTRPPPSSSSDSSSSDSSSSDSSSATTTPSPTPITSVSESVSSGSDGVRTFTSTQVTTFTPAATPAGASEPSTTSQKKSKIPIIVGCAVGIPVALAFLGILIWLLRKRSHQKKNAAYGEKPDSYANGNDTPEFAGGAKFKNANGQNAKYRQDGMPGVAELPSQTVGPERPVSMLPGKAELGGGPGFAPGTTPVAPHLLGVGGGTGTGAPHTPQSTNSWASAPPGYSPGQNQASWAPGHEQNAPTASMPDAQTYMPYRPPQGHPGHLSNVPEVAELPVNTPPAVELSGPSPPAVAELRTDQSPPAVGDTGSQRMPPR